MSAAAASPALRPAPRWGGAPSHRRLVEEHLASLPHGLPRPQSHAAGLRRLSTRASAPSTPRTPAPPSPSAAAGPAPSPSAVLAHLAAAGVPVLPGLSATELALAEAALGGVQLPPDLRELLALGALGGRLPGLPAVVAAVLPLAPGQCSGRAAPPPLVPCAAGITCRRCPASRGTRCSTCPTPA